MDTMSMVSGLLAAQAGNTQMQVAATILKSMPDAEKSAVLTLLGAAAQASSLANVGAGIGGNLERHGIRLISSVIWTSPKTPAAAGFTAAVISLTASSLSHSAGPAMVAISQPWPSTSTEVGIPSARPIALKILKNLGFLVGEIAEPGQIGRLSGSSSAFRGRGCRC